MSKRVVEKTEAANASEFIFRAPRALRATSSLCAATGTRSALRVRRAPLATIASRAPSPSTALHVPLASTKPPRAQRSAYIVPPARPVLIALVVAAAALARAPRVMRANISPKAAYRSRGCGTRHVKTVPRAPTPLRTGNRAAPRVKLVSISWPRAKAPARRATRAPRAASV